MSLDDEESRFELSVLDSFDNDDLPSSVFDDPIDISSGCFCLLRRLLRRKNFDKRTCSPLPSFVS